MHLVVCNYRPMPRYCPFPNQMQDQGFFEGQQKPLCIRYSNSEFTTASFCGMIGQGFSASARSEVSSWLQTPVHALAWVLWFRTFGKRHRLRKSQKSWQDSECLSKSFWFTNLAGKRFLMFTSKPQCLIRLAAMIGRYVKKLQCGAAQRKFSRAPHQSRAAYHDSKLICLSSSLTCWQQVGSHGAAIGTGLSIIRRELSKKKEQKLN